jgi:hypothetical protein
VDARHKAGHDEIRLQKTLRIDIDFDSVIPGPSEATSPESIFPVQGLWIPGSPLRGTP